MIAICGALTGQVLFGLLGDQVPPTTYRPPWPSPPPHPPSLSACFHLVLLLLPMACLAGRQFGRKWTFISTALLTILGTVLQACATVRRTPPPPTALLLAPRAHSLVG